MGGNIQRFGRFLGGIVMPNIVVFTVWGLITALLTLTGRIPDETLAQMVVPVQRFLLLTLIAYTGGKMVYDVRDGVVGVAAAIGVLAETKDPMSIGAMIASPLGGWLVKKVDGSFAGKILAGFEMLVNNFSTGILGALLAVFECLIIESLCVDTRGVLVICVDFLVKHNLLLLTSLFVEPTRVLFLNNIIDHGIFTPLGMGQIVETGRSIFFLIEANPGPGLGLLLAYSFFGKRAARSNIPNAVIIHFPGGVYEIYFPCVLMSPLIVLVVAAGGISGVLINSISSSGLASAASPGSTITILRICAKDSYIGVVLGVIVVAAVSFVIIAFTLKFGNGSTDDSALGGASTAVGSMKGGAKDAKLAGTVGKIIFTCDAGMGSSAMGATTLTKKLNAAGMGVTVGHFALDDVPKDTQVIITYKSLVERTETRCPNTSVSLITNFTSGKEYDEIVTQFTKQYSTDISLTSISVIREELIAMSYPKGMIYSSRLKKILQAITRTDGYVRAEEFAKRLRTSSRTTFQEPWHIDNELKEYHVHLVSKAGMGIYMGGSYEDKKVLRQELSTEQTQYPNKEERQHFLIFELLRSDKVQRLLYHDALS